MPDDDDGETPPRPLFGPVFWVVIALSVVCVAAGVAVALFGPTVFAPSP